jgi:hypothetical protein
MKKLLQVCIAVLFTAAIARADVTIEQKLEMPGMIGHMIMKVKGDRMRMDIPGPTGESTVIMDLKSGEMITLMHEQKMMMKLNMKQAKAAAEAATKAGGPDVTKMTPKATGEKEKVGEWDCEIYTLDMGNGMTTKTWVAKNYPNAKAIMAQMNKLNSTASAGMGLDWGKMDLGGMAVKTEAATPQGKIVSTLVSAKEGAIADTEFDVPAGYTPLELPNLPNLPK